MKPIANLDELQFDDLEDNGYFTSAQHDRGSAQPRGE
jgi:hypothetical protein